MSCLVPCCCLVAKLCLTPCNPMNCSTPGFPVLHLPELAQTRPLSRWYHPIISSSVVHFSSYLLSFPASGSFPVSQLFASGGQSTGALALASVLPMNIQGLFPLVLTGSPCSPRDSQESSPVLQFESINSYSAQPSLWSNSHIHTWLLEKNHSYDYTDLCQQSSF